MKKVLIIAYHFPPQSGSSGLLRSLKFSSYLLENGWLPVVLTVNERAYERLDWQQITQIPPQVSVQRTFALDAKRHLSIRGRYSRWLALPDRWSTWCLGAIPCGLVTVLRRRVDVIFTTFPIATAVLIGLILHRLTRKPWIIDLRDSMTEDDYPRNPLTRRVCRWIEEKAIQYGSSFIFTAESAREMYLKRYPQLSASKCLLISNGYDEEDFKGIPFPSQSSTSSGSSIRLLHAGLIYPEERDPGPFFAALSRLRAEGRIDAETLRVELRASGTEAHFEEMICELQIDGIVHLLPALPYHELLSDAARADGLLLFQAASCDHQIPAKVYEYLRLARPILALTSHQGDTAKLLQDTGGATIVDLADQDAIYKSLPQYLQALRSGSHPLANRQKVENYSRKIQTQQLANCMQRVLTV